MYLILSRRLIFASSLMGHLPSAMKCAQDRVKQTSARLSASCVFSLGSGPCFTAGIALFSEAAFRARGPLMVKSFVLCPSLTREISRGRSNFRNPE
jgi:hypothetical protein